MMYPALVDKKKPFTKSFNMLNWFKLEMEVSLKRKICIHVPASQKHLVREMPWWISRMDNFYWFLTYWLLIYTKGFVLPYFKIIFQDDFPLELFSCSVLGIILIEI